MAISPQSAQAATRLAAPLPPSFRVSRAAPRARSSMLWQPAVRDREKRQAPRRSLRCTLVLIDNLGERKQVRPSPIPAECSDIGDGGLYGIVPIGYGVAIGQRYTFQLTIGERGPEPGSRRVVSQQGEIVRAELLLGEGGYGDRVGVGVRLFGPRSGLVPMPLLA